MQNIWTLARKSAWIWTDPTELHFSLFYWFKRCTWRRASLCGRLVTSHLKHQTWRVIRSVIEFSESKSGCFRAEWNNLKLLRCQQQGKKFALFLCKKRWPYLQSFNERHVVDIRDFKIQRRGRQRERQKNNWFISKTTTSHVHHTFLYISFPFLHDYDVKMPHFAFYGGRKQATTKFYFSFWAWIWSLEIQLQEGSPTIDKVSG